MNENGEKKELTPKQTRTLAALISARNIGEACQAAGIGRTTLTRWLNDAAFTEALADAQKNTIADAQRVLIGGQAEALDTLRQLMTSGQSEAVRRQAANDWLTHLFKYLDVDEFERRLKELEAEVKDFLR
jgi:hypothetical protein